MLRKSEQIWQRLRARAGQTDWKDVLTFLFFVVLATALWFGHAMQSVRNARVVIPVLYSGMPKDAYLNGGQLPTALKIEVRDAGQRLRMYQVNPPELTIDLSNQMRDEDGEIRISSDVLRRSVTDLLQGTSKLVSVEPEQIVCPYTRQQEKAVPVVLQGEFVPAAEYQLVGEPQLLQPTAKIYGTEVVLAGIQELATENRVVEELKDTTVVSLALAAPKGVRLAQDSVSVQVVTERFTEKQFRLPVHIRETHEGERVRVFPQEVSVVVRVGVNHFTEVDAEDFEVTCPYPTMSDNKLAINVVCHNPYVTNIRFFPQEAEFIVER